MNMSAITGHAAFIQAPHFYTGFQPMAERSMSPKTTQKEPNTGFTIKDFRNFCHYKVNRQNSDASSRQSVIENDSISSDEDVQIGESVRSADAHKQGRLPSSSPPNLSFGIDNILSSKRHISKDSESSTSKDNRDGASPAFTRPTNESVQNVLFPNIKDLYERQYKLYMQYLLSGYGQNSVDMMTEYYRKGGFISEEAYKKFLVNSQQIHTEDTHNAFGMNPLTTNTSEHLLPTGQYFPSEQNDYLNARRASFTNYLTGLYPSSNNVSDLFPSQISLRNVECATRRRRKWKRAVFSLAQRKALESSFKCHKYVTKPERKKLADNLRLSENQVKIWYQNRRMKWRQTPKSAESNLSETTET